MSIRRLVARGAATPEVAWERYERIALWPTWSPQITAVETDADRIALGVQGTVRTSGGFRLPFTVTAVDPSARTWSWLVRRGPLALSLHHEVGAERAGTRTGLVMEGPEALLLAYAPLAWLALQRLVAR